LNLYCSNLKHVLFNERTKNSYDKSNREYWPIIREADPGGLGACPQEKTLFRMLTGVLTATRALDISTSFWSVAGDVAFEGFVKAP
jgi:hypothetical protein